MVREVRSIMGAERERISSKPLHNFTLPRSWGNQKQLRCMQPDAKKFIVDYDDQPPHMKRQQRRSPPLNGGGHSSLPPWRLRILEEDDGIDERYDSGSEEVEMSETEEEDEGGIKAVKEKIMMDLRIEADKMKAAFLRGKQPLHPLPPPPPPPPPPPERPWNLRTRKPPVSKTGNFNFNGNKGLLGFGEEKKNKGILISSPEKEQPEERAKFSSTLTKEIEEDFMKMVGHRPARRPKKRPRVVQKKMDNLFPGTWLTEVTADDYKVDISEEIKKK